MPDNSKIKTTIKCQNIAPLENLNKEFQSNSLKIAVFANNGCGKRQVKLTSGTGRSNWFCTI
jgi:hypothetical protein